jgi:thiamine pyrophosphate-dependent acetolactate synthase large subunit-like protein
VSHITVPVDVQESDADLKPFEGGLGLGRTLETAPIYLQGPVVPAQADLVRAAEVLNAEAKMVMLVGVGALGARDEVLATAELLASPIVKTLPGKAVVPDGHPLVTGGLVRISVSVPVFPQVSCRAGHLTHGLVRRRFAPTAAYRSIPVL